MSTKKSKTNPLIGLLVGTPLNDGAAVVVDATKIRGNLYKGTIISKEHIIVAKFRLNSPEVNEPIDYVDYHAYKTSSLTQCL